jgi:uncharacterized protein (TIGR02271 family)
LSAASPRRCFVRDAALTYSAVLSLFPALLAFVSLLGIFGQAEKTTEALLKIVGGFAPAETVEAIRQPVQELTNSSAAGFTLVLGTLTALWFASGYVGAFARAMNRVYEIDEGRPFIRLRGTSAAAANSASSTARTRTTLAARARHADHAPASPRNLHRDRRTGSRRQAGRPHRGSERNAPRGRGPSGTGTVKRCSSLPGAAPFQVPAGQPPQVRRHRKRHATVPLQREEVPLEREPITEENRDAPMSGPDLTEDEHEITLHEGRTVVEKETVPVERVRLNADTVTEHATVNEEVRKENIDTDTDTGETRR